MDGTGLRLRRFSQFTPLSLGLRPLSKGLKLVKPRQHRGLPCTSVDYNKGHDEGIRLGTLEDCKELGVFWTKGLLPSLAFWNKAWKSIHQQWPLI